MGSDKCVKQENECGKGYELLGWEWKGDFEKSCQGKGLFERGTWDRHVREAAMEY